MWKRLIEISLEKPLEAESAQAQSAQVKGEVEDTRSQGQRKRTTKRNQGEGTRGLRWQGHYKIPRTHEPWEDKEGTLEVSQRHNTQSMSTQNPRGGEEQAPRKPKTKRSTVVCIIWVTLHGLGKDFVWSMLATACHVFCVIGVQLYWTLGNPESGGPGATSNFLTAPRFGDLRDGKGHAAILPTCGTPRGQGRESSSCGSRPRWSKPCAAVKRAATPSHGLSGRPTQRQMTNHMEMVNEYEHKQPLLKWQENTSESF